eukprot:ctg_3102.g616
MRAGCVTPISPCDIRSTRNRRESLRGPHPRGTRAIVRIRGLERVHAVPPGIDSRQAGTGVRDG